MSFWEKRKGVSVIQPKNSLWDKESLVMRMDDLKHYDCLDTTIAQLSRLCRIINVVDRIGF